MSISGFAKRTYKRVDLRSNSILESKNYYLQTGDVIYVEPSKTKIAQNDTRRWQTMTFAATALSLLTIILLRLWYWKYVFYMYNESEAELEKKENEFSISNLLRQYLRKGLDVVARKGNLNAFMM